MAEQADDRNPTIEEPLRQDGTSGVPPAAETAAPHSPSRQFIDRARVAAAIAVGFCGPCYLFCLTGGDPLGDTPRLDLTWQLWAFGIVFFASLIAAVAVVVACLVRPAAPGPITLGAILVRTPLLLLCLAAVYCGAVAIYEPGQIIGTTLSAVLVLSAMGDRGIGRVVLTALATLVIVPALLATQSAYQYAHRHAEEIVAAGCELMDQCAEKRAGRKIDASDPSMPDVLRRLGARCVVVQENCVAVYVPGLPHTGVFVPGFADKEFHILRSPDDQMARVFVVRGKCRQVRITEQLWMAEDS